MSQYTPCGCQQRTTHCYWVWQHLLYIESCERMRVSPIWHP